MLLSVILGALRCVTESLFTGRRRRKMNLTAILQLCVLCVCVCVQVAWVPLQEKGEFGVLSASSGGRVLLWTVDSDLGSLVLNAAYALVRQQVPHSSSSSSSFKVSPGLRDDTETKVNSASR